MTKLPEPAEETLRNNERFFIYTKEQMLQFRRDALEEAAKLMWKKAGELGIFNHHATKELIGCVTKLKDET